MKRMFGTTWSLFYATSLAVSLALGGCAEKSSDSGDSSAALSLEREPSTEGRSLTRVVSKAQEAPREEEEEVEAEEFDSLAGGTGTAMALDEGKMGKLEAIEQARSAGIVGSLGGMGSGAGTGTGYGTIGTGSYGTIGHGAGTGRRSGRGSGQYAMKSSRALPSGMARQAAAPDSTVASTEAYKDYGKNPMVATVEDRLSTFAVDVDTASYTIARKKINQGDRPPAAAVRVEEFVNYFRYQYPGPVGERPFAVHMDAAPSPFTKGRHLLRVGVQAKKLSVSERKPANLVFLVDVSGSMQDSDKLGLAKRALRVLVGNLKDGDTVSMVTYAGRTDVVLEPTGLERKSDILAAIENLDAGGSTAMGSGIDLAYRLAARNLGSDTISRVIVLSDGDANVGDTSHQDILATIKGQVKEGVTLSTIGFGMGNYKDELMEQLADKGNGNYYYIDGISQARRVFQEQIGGTLEVVAKDVKIQVDFDPEVVTRYRLIGYENRDVADRDFRNDRVDAGEIGAGHTVTAMYEIEFAKGASAPPAVVRIRAKKPRGERASEWMYAFDADAMSESFAAASPDFRFATAVVGAAEILRESEHASKWRMSEVIDIAEAAAAGDGDRREFIELMRAIEPKLADASTRDDDDSGAEVELARR